MLFYRSRVLLTEEHSLDLRDAEHEICERIWLGGNSNAVKAKGKFDCLSFNFKQVYKVLSFPKNWNDVGLM